MGAPSITSGSDSEARTPASSARGVYSGQRSSVVRSVTVTVVLVFMDCRHGP